MESSEISAAEAESVEYLEDSDGENHGSVEAINSSQDAAIITDVAINSYCDNTKSPTSENNEAEDQHCTNESQMDFTEEDMENVETLDTTADDMDINYSAKDVSTNDAVVDLVSDSEDIESSARAESILPSEVVETTMDNTNDAANVSEGSDIEFIGMDIPNASTKPANTPHYQIRQKSRTKFQIEIKDVEECTNAPDSEEDLELNDPIGGTVIADIVPSTETVQRKELSRRLGHKPVSDSEETLTADEIAALPVDEHAYHKVIKPKPKPKRIKRIPPRYVYPTHIRGILETRGQVHHCVECGKDFNDMEAFLTHYSNHPKWPHFPFDCKYCTCKFQKQADAVLHQMEHSKLEAFTCPICHIKVYSALGLANHMDTHRIPNLYYKCNLCSARFSTSKQLHLHKQTCKSSGRPSSPVPRTRTVHVCFHCGRTEQTWNDLVVHLRNHKGSRHCNLCSAVPPSSDKFIAHMSLVHNDHGELTYYRCANVLCDKEYISVHELQKHEQNCTSKVPEYRCEVCGQQYREVDHFVTHMKLHGMLSNEGTSLLCEYCSFVPGNAAEFATHMSILHGFCDDVNRLQQIYFACINNR